MVKNDYHCCIDSVLSLITCLAVMSQKAGVRAKDSLIREDGVSARVEEHTQLRGD